MATYEYMSAMCSPEQDKLRKDVIKQTKEIPCFECGGLLFRGNRGIAALEFAYNNPTGGDFYVWLQQHYKVLGNYPN